MSLSPFNRTRLATLAGAMGLAACATTAVPPAPPAPPAAVAASAVGVAPPNAATVPAATPALRPFAEIIKEATRQDGFVPVWRKDDKVWLEIAPERLGVPMMVSVNAASSVGERGLYGSQMGPRWLGEFRRIGNQFQLLARPTGFRGERDPASQRAVAQAFSESLLGSGAVLSAPHPERKSVLVDASFLLGDLAGTAPGWRTHTACPSRPTARIRISKARAPKRA